MKAANSKSHTNLELSHRQYLLLTSIPNAIIMMEDTVTRCFKVQTLSFCIITIYTSWIIKGMIQ